MSFSPSSDASFSSSVAASWLRGRAQVAAEHGSAAGHRPALSSVQISPQDEIGDIQKRTQPVDIPSIEYAKGGRYLKVRIPGRGGCGVRGDREPIRGFSFKSRRALLTVVNQFDQEETEPGALQFVTLTYPKNFPSARASKRDLDRMVKAFERAWGPRGMIWKLEPQKRGAPHFHLLIMHGKCSAEELEQVLAWWCETWHKVAGAGDANHLKWHQGKLGNRPCVELVRDWQGVANYAAKYLGKTFDANLEWKHPGRYWGVRRRELLPIKIIGEDVERVVATRVRRACIAWYERQPAVGFYKSGKLGLPGQVLRPSDVMDFGLGERLVVRDCWQKIAEVCEVEVRPRRRRWPTSAGGCSMFMSVKVFKRIVDWAKSELSVSTETCERLELAYGHSS